MTLTIELPESLAQELSSRHVTPHQIRAFVLQAIEAWLRVQSSNPSLGLTQEGASRFGESATPFVEKLVRENRELFERLAVL